jgi:hypothetical protein
MRYIQYGAGAQWAYPDHSVSPKEKGRDFCMAYAKAAWHDWSFVYPKGIFSNNSGDYDKYRLYALGKQPISPYKKYFGIDKQNNHTWLTVDWTVRPIVSQYRDKAISRLMKQSHNIVATPIDMMAKSELDQYYADMKAKLAVQQLMQQVNQELGSHPMIKLQSGEPMDMEELEMRISSGEQFNRSKDAELAIEVGLYENNFEIIRRSIYEDLFDYGVAGYKDWLGDDNKAKFRRVDPQSIIINYCRKPDFSDLIHAGEVIDVSLIDLALVTDAEGNKLFDDKTLQEFAGSIAGRWGNPSFVGPGTAYYKPYDKFKCKVFDIYFYTYNDYTFTDRKTKDGNPVFRMEEYNRGKEGNDRYKRKCFREVYKCKWIVGTDYCYDWGKMEDQKMPQNPKKKAMTELPYKFIAYNFYEMKAQGIMERLVPYLDEYQLTTLKIQNWKNRAVPSGWWIDLEALENVALSKGGKAMQPKELLQMFFETGVLVGRSKTPSGEPMGPNWKPVIPIENSALSELVNLYQDLENTIRQIEATTGYNPITAGDPNPKTLVPGYETANISTDDALFPLSFSERFLSRCLAENVLLRMQQGVQKGGAEGYGRALNSNTLTFIRISPAIALREYGIELEERTSDDQRMWLMQQLQQDIANGFLDTSDAIQIINTHNAKQAQQILAYRVKKAKEVAQQQEIQKIQEASKSNAQVAQAAEQAKAQTMQLQQQFELHKEQMKLDHEYRMKQLEMEVKDKMNEDTAHAKIAAQTINSQGQIEKQHVANERPVSSGK